MRQIICSLNVDGLKSDRLSTCTIPDLASQEWREGESNISILAASRSSNNRGNLTTGDKRQWVQIKTWETLSEHKEKLLNCEGSWKLEQVARRICGVSILGDIQHLTGRDPGQPVPADPALSRVVD
ncbi:hypothetical protein QYF61_003002 [Mycteria americana]|uniref:Uncharacterized protein n=1 Tax=Mycteria americana TaxID=33587 RepID=A0AAN7RRA5_MYCAM|nr:hypothetical protein QYF61_003002 [Mycteria americana]